MMQTAMRRIALAAVLIGGVGHAKGAFVITFAQVGSDVVASGSGTLNFYDLSFVAFEYGPNHVDAGAGTVMLGPVPATYTDIYTGDISGPTSFGPGSAVLATSGDSTVPGITGVGINGAAQILYIPGGYFASDSFTASATWAGTTIQALGLTAGTYTWTWGTANPDSLTVIIPASVIPEPSALISLGMGGVAVVGLARRRRKAA